MLRLTVSHLHRAFYVLSVISLYLPCPFPFPLSLSPLLPWPHYQLWRSLQHMEVITFEITYLTKKKSCCTRIFFLTRCKDLLARTVDTVPLPSHFICRTITLTADSLIALHFLHLFLQPSLRKEFHVLELVTSPFTRYFVKRKLPHLG